MKKVYQFIVRFDDSVMTVVADSGATAIDKANDLLTGGRPFKLELAGTFDFDDYAKLFQGEKVNKVDSLEAMALMLKGNGYSVKKSVKNK